MLKSTLSACISPRLALVASGIEPSRPAGGIGKSSASSLAFARRRARLRAFRSPGGRLKTPGGDFRLQAGPCARLPLRLPSELADPDHPRPRPFACCYVGVAYPHSAAKGYPRADGRCAPSALGGTLRPDCVGAPLARVVGLGRYAPSPDGGRGGDSPLTLLPAATWRSRRAAGRVCGGYRPIWS